MIEEWRDIAGFEGLYEISDHGNLRNARNKRLRKLTPNKHGHMVTVLTKPGYRQNIQAHRLVAQAFIPNPENLPCVLHWDDVPSNNHISNLRWGTYTDNQNDIVRNGNHFWANKEKCPSGHLYTEDNIYITSANRRLCKRCRLV